MNKLIRIVTVLIMACILCSCGEHSNSNNAIQLGNIENDLLNFIQTGEKSELFTDSIRISTEDVYEGATINNIYTFDYSIYLQVNKSMYRFQFNENNMIESYIKYELEA